jgi:hypothetical protein
VKSQAVKKLHMCGIEGIVPGALADWDFVILDSHIPVAFERKDKIGLVCFCQVDNTGAAGQLKFYGFRDNKLF